MIEGQQMPAGPARGTRIPGGRRQLVIKLDVSQFEEVRQRAIHDGTSVAEQVRLLIEWGLESVETAQ